MHRLGLPAGSTIRLTASARPDIGVHRWGVRVFAAEGLAASATPRLTYGSQIGGGDCEQRIDIPAQDTDCRLEAWSRHSIAEGWADDRCSVEDDTPSRLMIGFSDPSRPKARKDDVLLSFTFEGLEEHP